MAPEKYTLVHATDFGMNTEKAIVDKLNHRIEIEAYVDSRALSIFVKNQRDKT